MKEPDRDKLKAYLYSRDDVIVAYIFGSYASKRHASLSDIDIAVLLKSSIIGYFKGSHKYSIEKVRKVTPDT